MVLALCLVFSTLTVINISAAENGIYSAEIGNVRVQILSATLARVELKGSGGYEDRATYHIVNHSNWPGAAAEKVVESTSTKIVTQNYTVVVPNNATSLTGIYVTDQNGKNIWNYTSLPTANQYLPAPGSTPKAWAIADNPRVVPAPWGYDPMPAGETAFANYNGWDSTNNSPDMFIFMPQGDSKRLRKDFIDLTGTSELVPIKTLGLWQSRYYPYSEQTALETIDKYRQEGFPLDYFVVDTDWRVNASTGYGINTKLFPDMERFLNAAHAKNVDIMFNDHPEPVNGNHALSKDDLEYRNTNLKTLLNMGLDSWWYDRNWHTTIKSPFDGIPKESFGMYLYDAITRSNNPNKRPLIMGNVDGIDNGVFNRAPNLASHKYSIQWTGDTYNKDTDLKQEIVDVVKSGALTSMAYVSTDVGGHNGSYDGSDQWVRWSQFAALSPFFRYHCTSGASIYREPWMFSAEAEDIARDYVNMRYRLIPLLYSLSHRNYETGLPITQRLDYNYPGYAEAQDDTQYTLGDGILVAPIWESNSPTTAVPGAWLSNNGQPGLSAEYFNNVNLTGTPVLTRTDADVNFNWGNGSPATGVNSDKFSARWTGEITIGNKDSYIAVTSDDGVRLWVDGELVIDNWKANDSSTRTTPNFYKAGSKHSVKIEYYEDAGGAVMRLQYSEVTETGNSRTVFIPDGRWIDVWTGAEYVGPQTITVRHQIDTSPIFVRSGTIVPLAENMSYIGEKPWSTIGVDVYPSTKLKGTSELYEDDQKSVDYKNGSYRSTNLETSYDNGNVVVKIGAANGSYNGSDSLTSRTWKVRVHAPASWGALQGITLNGTNASASVKKLTKDASGYPFAVNGGTPDADVYELTFNSNVAKANEIRVKFATPQDETLPTYSDIRVDTEVSKSTTGATVNLTSAGSYDWVHYGSTDATSVTRKATGDKSIDSLSYSTSPSLFNVDNSIFTWTDGDVIKMTNSIKSGISIPNGSFDFDVTVGPQEKKITLFLGGNNSSGRLTISDGTASAANLVELSNLNGSYGDRVVVNARADQETKLHFKYTKTGGTGPIAIMAAAVSKPSTAPDVEVERFACLENVPATVNLSDSSNLDWVHYGHNNNNNAMNRKSGANLLSALVRTGSGGTFNDYQSRFSFTDGTPTQNVSSTTYGVQVNGTMQISAPSSTTWKQLKVYLGCWNATNRVDIFDETGNEVTSFEFSASGSAVNRCLVITYRSEEESNINVKMTKVSGSGNISIAAYTLSNVEDSQVKLSTSLEEVPATLNLSDNKYLEWEHFGYGSGTAVNKKATPQTNIYSNVKCILAQGLDRSNDFKTVFSWSDGSPTASVSGTKDFAYSFDGMDLKLNVQPGDWLISLYSSLWWSKGYAQILDESGAVIDVLQFESRIATTGSSEYRKINLLCNFDKAENITVRVMPSLAFDGHRGNMSIAAMTVEKPTLDHVSIIDGNSPKVLTELVAKVYASANDSLEFASYNNVTFQWQSATNGTFTDIPNATSSIYTPKPSDMGKHLKVKVTYDGKTVEAATSEPVTNIDSTPKFTDDEGNELKALSSRILNVSMPYANLSNNKMTLKMYVAIYTNEDVLQYLGEEIKEVDVDTIGNFNVTIDMPPNYNGSYALDGHHARVFLWDSETRAPMIEHYNF